MSTFRKDTAKTDGDGRVLVIFQKNRVTEQQVRAKQVVTRGTNVVNDFIEIREWWYREGPTEEPIPTKKGTMVHRKHAPKLAQAILRELNPGEVDEETLADIHAAVARLKGQVD